MNIIQTIFNGLSPAAPAKPTRTTPLNVSGFYKVTGPTEATFYATTDTPITLVGSGWYSDSIFGIDGKVRVKSVSFDKGPGYNWSFVFQTTKKQNIEGTQQVIASTLYPPENVAPSGTQVAMYGYYTITAGTLTFFFTVPPPNSSLSGWIVTGLPGLGGTPLKVINYGFNYVTLVPTDGSTLHDTNKTVNVSGFPATLQESSMVPFIPGKFTNYSSGGEYLPNVQVQMNPNIHVGNYAEQRQLNTDVSWQDVTLDGRIFPQAPLIEPGTGIKGLAPFSQDHL
jgi:hypothetical protein